MFSSVLFVPSELKNCIVCIPCQTAKEHCTPISVTSMVTTVPLQLIHIDLSGPVTPSLAGNKYALSILDDFTSKSDVFFLEHKSSLPNSVANYQVRSDREIDYKLMNIRLDGAGENSSDFFKNWCASGDLKFEFTPPYASQSNGAVRWNGRFKSTGYVHVCLFSQQTCPTTSGLKQCHIEISYGTVSHHRLLKVKFLFYFGIAEQELTLEKLRTSVRVALPLSTTRR